MIKSNGGPKDLVDDAYQFMRVVECRGQLMNDADMFNTFNVIYKIYIGMEGRVTPRELNMILSSFGGQAKKMNDDEVYRSAAILSIRKQDSGY